MPLTLKYKGETTVPVEVEDFLPEAVRDKSLADIEKWPLYHGNREVPLAEFFDVSGEPGDMDWRFEGDLSGVHWIGAKMIEGSIHIAGNAGRHIGSDMTGGEITVEGDAGDWVGGEMRGGRITVHGNAGHLVGAAYRGAPRGMSGGTILVHGNVGNEIGHTLRRGLIAVGGDCGDGVGFNMLAGTILVLGQCGIRPGAGMKRGTIALLGNEEPTLLPTFRYANTFDPLALKMVFRELAALGFPLPTELVASSFALHHGDFIEGGRGEIFVRAA
ncbi:MAG: formylmethanofuran dehydrogenase subunit C [Pirellulales bacterium]|nr:formylmethanofuran dehydrogenase subunit C [Pirellulales bacterium]